MPPLNPIVTPAEKVIEALVAYYRQADELVVTEEELLSWFATLAPHRRRAVYLLDPCHWIVLPQCRQYLLECRGYSLSAYMASHLTSAEFRHWLARADDFG